MPASVLDDSLADMLNETVSIRINTGVSDKYSTSKFAAAVVYPARIDEDVRSIRTQSGEVALSTLQVFVLSLDAHTTEDEITLPAAYVPNKPPILKVEPIQDEGGQTMVVIYT